MGADVPCLIILLPSSKTMPTAKLAEIGVPQKLRPATDRYP
jgi:hypothetical protein